MFRPEPCPYNSDQPLLPLQLYDLNPSFDCNLFQPTGAGSYDDGSDDGGGGSQGRVAAMNSALNMAGTITAPTAVARPSLIPHYGFLPDVPVDTPSHLRQHQPHHKLYQQVHHTSLAHRHLLSNHHFSNHQCVTRMDLSESHDMAAQQEAAKDYQPHLEGPAVGDKTTIDTITNDYAKADPVYVEKTMALPQMYSHYRPVKGDGNCGWRVTRWGNYKVWTTWADQRPAIAFSYFEKLVELGDQAQIEGEAARLLSMNQMLGTVGGYNYYEDFADEAIGFLRDVASCIADRTAATAMVHERWNDSSIASSLIYYFRLLAATYLKANATTYDPFVPDGLGIHSYCSQSIELIDREIEQLGIMALVNVLLEPVDFVLEIVYLDRSPGSTANVYRFPEKANGQDPSTLGSIIYLLYRPDHYDILYRLPPALPLQSPVPPNGPITLQVNRATGFHTDTVFTDTATSSLGSFSTGDFNVLASLPGFMSSASSMSNLALASPSLSLSPVAYEPYIQDSSWLDAAIPCALASSTPKPPQPRSAVAPRENTHRSSSTICTPKPALPTTRTSPLEATIPRSSSSHSLHLASTTASPAIKTSQAGTHDSSSSGCNIRFSTVQLEYDGGKSNFPEQTFQVTTSTFKNSVWNRAHYGNPDFHPEEWNPDDEAAEGRISSKKRGKKET